jgi:hypothetical protein
VGGADRRIRFPEDTYIGQNVILGDRASGDKISGTVSQVQGDRIWINTDDGVIDFEIPDSSKDYLFLGAESWQDRTETQKLDDIGAYLYNLNGDSLFSQEFNQQIRETSLDKYFSKFKDTDLAKAVGSSLEEFQIYSGSGKAAASVRPNNKYTLKFQESNPDWIIVHEFTHGFHKTVGFDRDVYADMPSDPDEGPYPDFHFEPDGTSLTGIADMDRHLLQDDDGYIPGSEKKREIWDLAEGNFGLEFDSVEESEYFDPDDPDVQVGDILKVDYRGDIKRYRVESEPEKEQPGVDTSNYFFDVTNIDTRESKLLAYDHRGSFASDKDLLSVTNQDVNLELPISEDLDEVTQLIEGANLFWMYNVFQLSQWRNENLDRPDDTLDEIDHLWRAYDIRNPNEVITNTAELFLTNIQNHLSESQLVLYISGL